MRKARKVGSKMEEIRHIKHNGGYVIKEGKEALTNIGLREFLLRKRTDGSMFDFLLPGKVENDILYCQEIQTAMCAMPWYKLQKVLIHTPFRIGYDTQIDLKKELAKEVVPYLRVIKVDSYKDNEGKCWPSRLDCDDNIWLTYDPKDGGGYAEDEYYIYEIHDTYLTARRESDNSQEVRCELANYNKTWFDEQWKCSQYAQWLTRKERGMLQEGEENFVIKLF